jgi:hypothetical protein
LTAAERTLLADPRANPTGLGAADLGTHLGMYASTSDLRVPKAAVGGTSLSLHTFGLAVDLNYRGNPFIGNAPGGQAVAVIRRATGLVTGTAVDVTPALGDARASFRALDAADTAFTTYFSYLDPANRAALAARVAAHTPARGEPTDVDGWLRRIRQDQDALRDRGDFAHHKPPAEGFLDFDEAVVLALTGAGLTWGGTYRGPKDLMHFDYRTSAEGRDIDNARNRHAANQ